MAALIAGCCGGIVKVGKPYADQWPASVASPPTVAGLVQVKDAKRSTRAKTLLNKINSWFDQDAFTVLYADSADRRRLTTAIGVTRFIASPGSSIDDAFTAIGPSLAISDQHPVDAGATGAQARCGSGRVDGQRVIACGWADHGSLVVALFTNRSEAESAAMTRTMRKTLIKRRSAS